MNDAWAMNFVSSRFFDDRPFRILTIVDCFTRKALVKHSRTQFRAYQLIDELNSLTRPRSIRVDNDPEFACRLRVQWAYLNKVELDLSRPGKPKDKAYIKAYNSRLSHGSWTWLMPETGSGPTSPKLYQKREHEFQAQHPTWLMMR